MSVQTISTIDPDKLVIANNKNDNIILDCSNCRKKIATVIVLHKDESVKWKVRATCPYCKDKSFVKEVNGIIRTDGYIPNQDIPQVWSAVRKSYTQYMDDAVPETEIVNSHYNDKTGEITLEMKKHGK